MKIKIRRKVKKAKATEPLVVTRVDDLLEGLSPAQLDAMKASLEQQLWQTDPVDFVTNRCGEFLWSKQRTIAMSVVENRKTAVPSCHGSGKSFLSARVAAWWISAFPPGEAFVVSSAPTGRQVRVILWREIGRLQAKAKLPGRTNQTEWLMEMPAGNEEIVAFGMKPDDMSPTAFQGIHARRVLVIFDEATGIALPLWDAADSLTSNNLSRMLAIGNPDDPECEFARVCKPGSGWNVISISAFETPNFTDESIPEELRDVLVGSLWVEEKRKKWGETHPFWFSKVLGQFPAMSMDGSLIPLTWIRAAQERTLEPSEPSELGLDIGASKGGDPSCLGWRRGGVFRVLYEEQQPDTMKTTGRLIQHLLDPKYHAACAKVDYIGVGRGAVDRCKEQNLPVHPIVVSQKGKQLRCVRCHHTWRETDEQSTKRCPECMGDLVTREFADLLSELWWGVRTLFEHGQIDLDEDDDDLAAELLTLSWAPNSQGQIKVSYGKGDSPNRADSLLMAFAPVEVEEVEEEFVTW